MISDVLSDAGEKILEIFSRNPEMYRKFSSEIQELLDHMDAVRRNLDDPYFDSEKAE